MEYTKEWELVNTGFHYVLVCFEAAEPYLLVETSKAWTSIRKVPAERPGAAESPAVRIGRAEEG